MARLVCVVDDDALVRETIALDLQRRGFDTVQVGDGRRVTEVLAERPVDALVVDVLMPDMDGIEVIAAVRQRWPGLRIVAMSGGGLVEAGHYLHTAVQLGADVCLAKPFTGGSLAAAIGCAGRA